VIAPPTTQPEGACARGSAGHNTAATSATRIAERTVTTIAE